MMMRVDQMRKGPVGAPAACLPESLASPNTEHTARDRVKGKLTTGEVNRREEVKAACSGRKGEVKEEG